MGRALKVAECAVMYFRGGRLIWDDYVRHHQFELTDTAFQVCRRFAEFTDPDVLLADLDPADADVLRGLIDELCRAGVLIAEGSPEHDAEERLLESWSGWGHSAWQYHFASRTLADAHYASLAEQEAELDAKLAEAPAPPPFRSLAGATVPLPRVPLTSADAAGAPRPEWSRRPLGDVLLARHTTRDFGPAPLTMPELAGFLQVVAGPSPLRPVQERSATVFKVSASAGGRHPVEAYLHVDRVDGLAPGWYHYAAAEHVLEPLGGRWDAAQVTASAGDQDWVGSAAVVVYYVAVLERIRWKYDTARTYRMLQMDVGHLSQTGYLVAAAMGVGAGFSAALRDELIERELGVDPNAEIVLGLTALGHSA